MVVVDEIYTTTMTDTLPKRHPIIVIHGLSGVGKTTAQNFMARWYGVLTVHPIRSMKRMYETALQKPPGWLDTAEGKTYKPDGVHSMQEILVKQFHLHQEMFPLFSTGLLHAELAQALDYGPVAVTGIRRTHEAHALREYCESGHPLYILCLTRPNPIRKVSSDLKYLAVTGVLLDLLNAYPSSAMVTYNNAGTLDDLNAEIVYFMSDYTNIPFLSEEAA